MRKWVKIRHILSLPKIRSCGCVGIESYNGVRSWLGNIKSADWSDTPWKWALILKPRIKFASSEIYQSRTKFWYCAQQYTVAKRRCGSWNPNKIAAFKAASVEGRMRANGGAGASAWNTALASAARILSKLQPTIKGGWSMLSASCSTWVWSPSASFSLRNSESVTWYSIKHQKDIQQNIREISYTCAVLSADASIEVPPADLPHRKMSVFNCVGIPTCDTKRDNSSWQFWMQNRT